MRVLEEVKDWLEMKGFKYVGPVSGTAAGHLFQLNLDSLLVVPEMGIQARQGRSLHWYDWPKEQIEIDQLLESLSRIFYLD